MTKRFFSYRVMGRYGRLSRIDQTRCALQPGRSKGQTMMEYIILVALLGVASLPILKILGDTIRDRINMVANEIGGQSASSEAPSLLQNSKSKIRRSMKDYYHE